ncbi:hypothetical protein LCGC14_0258600 [marine sediment metagenome]|uniref:Uncharacterized protein n=1 Tax=marine sediment metagenome TaxID=412755 RepID=A0A0F9U2E2_9ZZZZ
MYAKLIVWEEGDPVLADGGDAEVVPRRHVIIEGDRFEYRKYLGPNLKAILKTNDISGEVLGHDYTAACHHHSSEPPRPYEVIHLTAWKLGGGDPKYYIAPLHQLYVMNDAGKTIDSMCCLIKNTSVLA